AVRARLAQLPNGVTWRQLSAVGILAGIGFTVSIFISSLAFDDASQLLEAKTAVLAASLLAGVLGYFALRDGEGASQLSNPAADTRAIES
ncbi:MAG: Na+/H+ antiporter NhaA, partial [Terriglobales bacterium]